MKKYGFLGLGIMGQAMAANLLKAGLTVTVWNRTTNKCDALIKKGALHQETPAQVVANSDITFAMVSDPAAAKELCFGKQGVLEGIGQGKGYIDVSTVDPQTSIEINNAIDEKDGRYLEAPVSGSKKPAEEGALVFLCAGDNSLYDEAIPAFELMGKNSFSTAFPLKHMQKDMRLALQMGDEERQALYTAGAANFAYIKARSKGYDDEDFSAVLKAISE